MAQSKRERQKQARQRKIEEVRRQEQRQASRRRGVMIGAGVVAFLVAAVAFSVLSSNDDDTDVSADSTSTTEADSTTTTAVASTTSSTAAEVLAGTQACPEADGSSERTLDFDDTFENCLTEGTDYQARFVTSEGEVLVDLLEDEMPNTVNNFVALARFHYYDDTLLFRTDPSIAIIQGGSPHTQDNADPGPGYTIPDMGGAFTTDPQTGAYTGPFTYAEGQLIMARTGAPDSSSAQFFFSTGPDVSLLDSQGTYLLFGEVLEGLDVLQAIIGLHQEDPDSGLGGAPSREVTVESVEIVEA